MSFTLRDKTEIKIFVLYLLMNSEEPVDFVTLHDMVVQDAVVGQFDFMDSFFELAETEAVQKIEKDGKEYFTVTPSGREAAKMLENDLSKAVRERVLELGVSQLSGGSKTSVGGYDSAEPEEENSAQFDVSDRRTLDEIVGWLLELGYLPSFCTACYREGRTGDRFMALVKRGQIANCCQPNALMTLKEYLMDYASADTLEKGLRLIREEIDLVPNPKIRERALKHLQDIEDGKRDFRF